MSIWGRTMEQKILKPTPHFATPGVGNTGVGREISSFQSSIVID